MTKHEQLHRLGSGHQRAADGLHVRRMGRRDVLVSLTEEERMQTFTIVAIYTDNMQRHATTVQAKDATDAQRKFARRMERKGEPMLIAGVVAGEVMMVDEQDNAKWPMLSDIENAG